MSAGHGHGAAVGTRGFSFVGRAGAVPLPRCPAVDLRGFPAPLAFLGPGHHPAQLRPDTLDFVILVSLPSALEVGPSIPVLLEPLPRERSILYGLEDPPHLRSRLIRHK